MNNNYIYKPSGIERIGEIPQNWKVIKWKYLSNEPMVYGANESAELDDRDLPRYIRITDLDSYGNLRNDTFRSLPLDKAKGYMLINGDILLARSGATVGKAYIHKDDLDACFAGYLIRFRPNQSKIIPKLVYYYTQTGLYADWIRENTIQATIQNVSAEKYANLSMPVPPIEEQGNIVCFLDNKTSEIDSLIADKEKLIKLLEEKRQAIINEAVTTGLNPNVKMKDSGVEWIGEIPEHWEIKKIKYLSTYVGSGKTPRGGGEIYTNEGVVFLRSMNVHFEGLRLNEIVYINPKIDEDMRSTRVQSGDILLNITGASIGRACIVPNDFPPANVNQHVCIIRPSQRDIVPTLLSKIMGSQIVQEQILMAQNGSSREGLNFPQVRNLSFPLSNSLEEQNEISNYIEDKTRAIYMSINDIQTQIEKLKEYRQSLIYEAVTGKIDVREYKKVLS